MIEKKNDDDNYVDPSLSKASYYEKLYQIADACGLKASIEVETTALKLSTRWHKYYDVLMLI